MKIFNFLICLFILAFPLSSNAQEFKTTFSVLGNQNNGKYNFVDKVGLYDTKDKSFNLGLGINTNYYPISNESWFLSLGLRLNTTAASISAINQIQGISTSTAPIFWWYRWQAFTVPFHFGKTIVPFKNSKFNMDVYAGISYGIIMGSTEALGTTVQKSKDDDELVGVGIDQQYIEDIFQNKRLMTIDVGMTIAPIPAVPNLSLGFAFIYNIQATKDVKGGGFVTNVSQQKQQDYYYNMNRRFNNYTFSINYSIGKKEFKKKQSGLDCFKN